MKNTTRRVTSGPGGERGHFSGYETRDKATGEIIGAVSPRGGGWRAGWGWWSDEDNNNQTQIKSSFSGVKKRFPFQVIEGIAVTFVHPVLTAAVIGITILDLGQAFYHKIKRKA